MSEIDYKQIVDKIRQYCYTHETADVHDIMELLDGGEIENEE